MMQDLNACQHDAYREATGSLRDNAPGWAPGLRKLYGVVADEPLPANFSELLKRLQRHSQDA